MATPVMRPDAVVSIKLRSSNLCNGLIGSAAARSTPGHHGHDRRRGDRQRTQRKGHPERPTPSGGLGKSTAQEQASNTGESEGALTNHVNSGATEPLRRDDADRRSLTAQSRFESPAAAKTEGSSIRHSTIFAETAKKAQLQ
jgi:hypothetical protein